MNPDFEDGYVIGSADEADRLREVLKRSSIRDYDAAAETLADMYRAMVALTEFDEAEAERDLAKAGFGKKHVEYKAGWYQDIDGNLYQYDGIVWDVVPENEAGELEFLG